MMETILLGSDIRLDDIKTLLATTWLRDWAKAKYKAKIEYRRCKSTQYSVAFCFYEWISNSVLWIR